MKSPLNSLVDYFIPKKLKSQKEVHWRARIISSIHIFLLFGVLISEIICNIFFPENQFPHTLSAIGLIIPLLAFKKWGSFKVSGNLLIVLLVLVLFPFSLTTGGLYSYDFVALSVAPLIGFLIAGRKYGFFWMGFLFFATVVLYYLETNSIVSYREVTYKYDKDYYLVLILFVQALIFSCVAIFDKGQRLIINELNQQRDLLKENKIELENKKAELLESNANLKHFAHVASHDLKQPIRTISSFGEILDKQLGSQLTKDQKVYLDFINSGAKQLQNQIDSILNHAKIGSNNEINLKTLETLPFVENILIRLQQQIIDSETKVTIRKLPFEFVASKIEIALVFQNIISNAIKFKKLDQPLDIIISCQENPDFYKFSISDNGVGVEPDIIDKIFTPMVKSYSSQNSEGTGMGLATCEKIIKRHQGEIWVESELGEGATFLFTISKNLKPTAANHEFGLKELVG